MNIKIPPTEFLKFMRKNFKTLSTNEQLLYIAVLDCLIKNDQFGYISKYDLFAVNINGEWQIAEWMLQYYENY